MDNEVTCPYCEEEFELCTDDGAYYDEGKQEEAQCPNCDKYVLISSSCSWYRGAEAADCLNGADHLWSAWYWLWQSKEGDNKEEHLERRYCQGCNEGEREWHKERLDKR